MVFSRFSVTRGVCWLVACGCCCLSATQDTAAQQAQIAQRESQRINAALDEQADWKLTDVPLREFAKTLGDRLEANVLVDAVALEDFGISTDTPVTVNLTGISGRSSLDLLLRDLDLGWIVLDGLLWISTREELESELLTKTYPVGDLVRSADGAKVDYDYDTLIGAITSSIAPDSWDQVGGPGSIEGIYAALAVSQVREVHEQIEYLLRRCRKLVQQVTEHPDTVPRPLVLDAAGGEKIRDELDKRAAVELQDAPLNAALDYIADLYRIPIVIDTNALDDFGIGTDVPITFEMKRLPLRNTLRILLDQLDLTFVVRDEVLLITSTEEAEAMLQTVVYPVGDLVTPVDLANLAHHEQYLDAETSAYWLDFDSLIDTITTSVGPASWDAVGGPSSIETLYTPTALLISQTEEIHEQIVNLLAELRRVKSQEQQRLELAAKANSESAEHFIKAYPLSLVGDEQVMIKQLVELLRVSLGPDLWQKDTRALLHSVGSTLVVRHTREVHRAVQRLLREVGVLSPIGPMGGSQPFSGGGGVQGGLF